MSWQPIETFFERSDRTGRVLLYIPNHGVVEGRCEFTGFHVWKTATHTFRGERPTHDPSFSNQAPTHWMPLPEPPSGEP